MCVCVFRPPGRHVGSFGQLQHHSEGAEAALQYAERREWHLGKLMVTNKKLKLLLKGTDLNNFYIFLHKTHICCSFIWCFYKS